MKKKDQHARVALTVLLPGATAVVDTLDEAINATLREQLVAYGLSAGRSLSVVQQTPMLVVLIDEIELALEAEVARHVLIRPVKPRGN